MSSCQVLYIIFLYHIKYSALYEFRIRVKLIISHVRLLVIISHVKIIAFKQSSIIASGYFILLEKIQHRCLEISDLFLVLDMTLLMISCSTLEINLVFPLTHVLFSMQIDYRLTYYYITC